MFFTSRNCHFRLFLGGFLISDDMQDDASGNGQNWTKNCEVKDFWIDSASMKWPFFRVFLDPYFPKYCKIADILTRGGIQ